jgi:ABC-2 type transport system permease protein
MLAIVLAGAALVREREHGTMDHLLVMPLTPFEIAMSKIWANALVTVVAVALSLYFVVRGLLGIPIAGSVPLFLFGVAIYLFFATAVGLLLGTIARSMPQLGLLYLLVYLPLAMLSGSNTPLESMPPWLATIVQVSPTAHFGHRCCDVRPAPRPPQRDSDLDQRASRVFDRLIHARSA